MKVRTRTRRGRDRRRRTARARAASMLAFVVTPFALALLLPWLGPKAIVAAMAADKPKSAKTDLSASDESDEDSDSKPRPRPEKPEPKDFSEFPKGKVTVFRAPIEGIVDLGMAPYVQRIVDEAEAAENGVVLLDINTLGGRVDAAIMIRDSLIDAKVPTIAFINPRAISAGAMISLACEVIAIRKGGTIGAATPISGGGEEEVKAAGEKFLSYMRTEMRATAEQRGRNGDVAEAMVDRDIAIEGVVKKGKVLTLTTETAMETGIADFVAADVAEVLETVNLDDTVIEERQMNWAEAIARGISHPAVSSFLMSIGFLGIVIELYQPGWGIPGTLGLLALITFFFGHHVVNLAGVEEILLFVLGLILLMIELLVIPGFGLFGLAGISLMIISLMLSLVGLEWEATWDLGLLREPIQILAWSMVMTGGLGGLFIWWMPKTKMTQRRLVLQEELSTAAGYSSHDEGKQAASPIGTAGTALSDLRPAGKIRLTDGTRLDAVSEGGFIGNGAPVTIVDWRSGSAVVRESTPHEGTETSSEVTT